MALFCRFPRIFDANSKDQRDNFENDSEFHTGCLFDFLHRPEEGLSEPHLRCLDRALTGRFSRALLVPNGHYFFGVTTRAVIIRIMPGDTTEILFDTCANIPARDYE